MVLWAEKFADQETVEHYAVEVFRRDPEYAETRRHFPQRRGDQLRSTGRWYKQLDDDLKAFMKSFERDPTQEFAETLLAMIRESPSYFAAQRAFVRCCEISENTDAIERMQRELPNLEDPIHDMEFRFARLYFKLRMFDKAIDTAFASLARNGNYGKTHSLLVSMAGTSRELKSKIIQRLDEITDDEITNSARDRTFHSSIGNEEGDLFCR